MMEQKKLLGSGMIFSLLLHLSVLTVAVFSSWRSESRREFKYFVSLVQFPAGGGGSGRGKASAGHVRELQEVSKIKAKPKLTYPVKNKKPRRKYVVRKKSSVIVKRKSGLKETAKAEGEPTDAPVISFSGTGIGTGSGMGTGEGEGGMQLGNFPFPFYLITVRERIGLNWFELTEGKSLGAEIWVYFKVNRDGKIIEIKLEKPCGISRFDSYALKAVKDAEPFPKLPKNYDGEFLAIRVIFE
ncbi:MAG: TonB C-terminal domain-containing protein [Candidatus Aminicenantes bacterium]|nr:TonB C-terminal domain-containing protein [Candidatus Aminicenantes bacterium]